MPGTPPSPPQQDAAVGTSEVSVISSVLLQSSNHHVQFLQCHFSGAVLLGTGEGFFFWVFFFFLLFFLFFFFKEQHH